MPASETVPLLPQLIHDVLVEWGLTQLGQFA